MIDQDMSRQRQSEESFAAPCTSRAHILQSLGAPQRVHTDNGDIIGQCLLNCQPLNVFEDVRALGAKRETLAIKPVLGEQKKRLHFLAKLKHEAIVIVSEDDLTMSL
jgi:hypothetical protein